MQAEICHVVHVRSIEFKSSAPIPFILTVDPLSPSSSSSTEPQPSAIELPTCPVCLERMDASVSGIVTTFCHHSFHCLCLSRWGDSKCPVCRYQHPRRVRLSNRRSRKGAFYFLICINLITLIESTEILK